MSTALQPRIVVTIHGIRTQGKWQKEITPYLGKHGLVPYHIDYGWFSALQFFVPFSRERQLRKFREELRDLVDRVGTRRISIIAHSFGTFLAMEALVRENGGFTYDRVVLTGSIVPCDFDWSHVMREKKWVMAVRNERATADWVVGLAAFAARRLHWISRLQAGASGRIGFTQKLPSLLDDSLVGDHSETHNVLKYDQWARFIAYPRLPDDLLEKVKTELAALRQTTATLLTESADNIRVNLFAPISGALRIVPGATENMTYAPELDLQIALGHGACGTAFDTGNACMVVKQTNGWSGSSLPGSELGKLCPSLRWVISLPVVSTSRKIPVGVINVDGLVNVPLKLQDADSQDCKAIVMALLLVAHRQFHDCLEAAFRGDFLPQMEV